MSTKSTVCIESRAPTRVDLAGGTLDLWPLYLFLDRPVTLNLGIDLFAESRLEVIDSSNGGEIRLASEDQGHQLSFNWTQLVEQSAPPQLELHLKLLRFFAAEKMRNQPGFNFSHQSISLTTRAKSPAGAGLGGSSTLSVAMAGCLATWARQGTQREVLDPIRDGTALIEAVRDVETTVIQVPAGVQDYYGAMFGGLQSLRWSAGQHQREWLNPALLPEIEARLLLFYSGQSRNSGINNWALFKGFIDDREPTALSSIRSRFGQIAEATRSLESALRIQDWPAASAAIAREWAIRRTLAPGITTREMDRAFESAEEITPIAGKVCGAGGGGCFFVFSASELTSKTREEIQKVFTEQGIRPLPFRAVPHGLEVRTQRA